MIDPTLIARSDNGAIQVDLPAPGTMPVKAMLAGPIKAWWGEGMWDTPLHRTYTSTRSLVRDTLVANGLLLFSAHTAWQGSWHEDAQRVNDMAIAISDVLIELYIPGIVADGTDAEVAVAKESGTTVLPFLADGTADVRTLVATLDGMFPGRLQR